MEEENSLLETIIACLYALHSANNKKVSIPMEKQSGKEVKNLKKLFENTRISYKKGCLVMER